METANIIHKFFNVFHRPRTARPVGPDYVGLALDRVDPLAEDAPIPMMSHKAGLSVIDCAYLVGINACRSASTSVGQRVQTEGPR